MVAGEHDIRPTCLSDYEHDCAIENHVLHYLGCIEISQRGTFYKDKNNLWMNEVENEYRRLIKESKGEQKYRDIIDNETKTKPENNSERKPKIFLIKAANVDEEAKTKAENIVEGKREEWQRACNTELRRIKYLRALLTKDEDSKQLVQDLKESRRRWEASDERRTGLSKVKAWREGLGKATSDEGTGPTITGCQTTTLPRREIPSNCQGRPQPTSFVDHAQSSTLRGLSREADVSSIPLQEGALPLSLTNRTDEDLKDYEPDKDYNLHIIEYDDVESREVVEGNQPVRDKRKLPDQKVKINKIFKTDENEDDRKKNPLYRATEPGKLRYIHLPANNMVVSTV
jgi:hypothetical protein